MGNCVLHVSYMCPRCVLRIAYGTCADTLLSSVGFAVAVAVAVAMIVGCWFLVLGSWFLVLGCWLLVLLLLLPSSSSSSPSSQRKRNIINARAERNN